MIEWIQGKRQVYRNWFSRVENSIYQLKKERELIELDAWAANIGPYVIQILSGDLVYKVDVFLSTSTMLSMFAIGLPLVSLSAVDFEDAKSKAMEWVKEQACLVISEVKRDFVETARERNCLNAL